MCGRYSIGTKPDVLAAVFRLATAPLFQARYNAAPTQTVPVIRADEKGQWRLDSLKWGFIPHWADDPAIGNRMINARAETAADKPAYRNAFRQRRCLIPADAFYEWKKVGRRKQPFAIRMRDHRTFAMAGLWESWRGKDGHEIESFTILTTEPNELVAPLHNRMPVILDPAEYDRWLDPRFADVAALQAMLHTPPAEAMMAYPVNMRLNRAEHDGPECLEPIAAPEAAPAAASEKPTLFDM